MWFIQYSPLVFKVSTGPNGNNINEISPVKCQTRYAVNCFQVIDYDCQVTGQYNIFGSELIYWHWINQTLELISVNTLRPRQDGRHFPDDVFKWIFLNEIIWILIKISLKFVPKGPINNIPALVQIMAWHHPGNKSLSEPMMVSLTTHICVTRPQWVNWHRINHTLEPISVK